MATVTPVFPAAVATDAQLKVANNLVKTSLKVSAVATDTILFVNSTAGFVPNCLVSIDKEIVSIASIAAGPNPALVVASGGRGFDGTSAAQHSAGAQVSMLIDAWHHNAVAAEVKAIQAFIGANGSNLSTVGTTALQASRYDFPQQSPGGSLIVGLNSITIAPVPNGVNGNDVGHCLWISGGTGAAEAVTISGGTAVSGGASGTLFITCANTHSGAWTIRSATAGIQEAVQTAQTAGGGVVTAGAATAVTINCNISITGNCVTLQLSGQGLSLAGGSSIVISGANDAVIGTGCTPITATTTAGDIIRLSGSAKARVAGLFLNRSSAGASGAGIHITGSSNVSLHVHSMTIANQYRGIWAETAPVVSLWSDIDVQHSTAEGVRFDQANDEHITNLIIETSGGHGLQIGTGAATSYFPGAFKLTNSVIYNNQGDGIHIEGSAGTPCAFCIFVNIHADTDQGRELYVKNAGAITFANSQFINGQGVVIDSGTSYIHFTGVRISGSSRDGLYLTGGARRIGGSDLTIVNSSLGTSTYSGIRVDGACNQVALIGVQIDQSDTTAAAGIKIDTTGGNPSAIHIGGVQMIAAGNMAATVVLPSGLTDVFIDGGSTWLPLTLANGWTVTAPPVCRLEFNGGCVRLRGAIAAGTTANGTVMFTLPAGYRPASLVQLPVVALSGGSAPAGIAQVAISNTGTVAIYNIGANPGLQLDAINFSLT